ncbi:ABC transporter permease [Enhygromyxa salina]|uniref:ABC transporter permease n=1 Tax=Enhygromyxa salina TaxID=215803 RepID=UPI0015E783CD|nr:ABC-2 family transporter protein [Enhygromyxa salina]
MSRHLRLLGAQMRLSMLAALEYRVGFWTEGVVGLAWSLGGVVPLFVAFEHRSDVAGWGPWELVLLTGFFLIISGVYASAVQPAVSKSMTQIRTGTLDYVLLRPVDALASCLTAQFEPWSLLEALTGIGLVIVAAVELELSPSLGQLGALLVVLVSGLVSLVALGVLMLCASFRALELQNLTSLMETLLGFAHWPISVFRGPLKLVFTFVVPFAVMTSYPAQSLIGGLGWPELVGAVGTTLALAIGARVIWGRALRGYTSASS